MPRESQIAITQRPVDQPTIRPEQLGVFARPVTSAIPSNPQSDLTGLLEGLKQFNPGLEKYLDVRLEKDHKDNVEAGTLAGKTAKIDPANVLAMPEAYPENLNPAFRPSFDKAYKESLGQRLGIQSSADISAEYENVKLTDGFDAKSWLHEKFQSAAGMQDPTVAAEISKYHLALSQKILAADNQVKLQQLQDSTMANNTAMMNGIISGAENDPAKLAEGIQQFMKGGAWQQYSTRPEMASKWVEMVSSASLSDKGNPALFDALDKIKDPTIGKTIAETSPELALKIQQARKMAQHMFDQKVEKDSQVINFQTMAQVEDGLKAGSTAYNDGWIAANTGGPGKLFPTTEAALAFRKKRDATLSANDDLATTLSWMKNGMGYLATPAQQKAAADYVTTPLVNQLMQVVNDPSKQGQINDLMAVFARVHSDNALTIPNETLDRFINGLTKVAPDAKGEVPPRFQTAAALYRAMPPSVRDLYFKDDAKTLFEHYTKEVDAATAPATAYQQAYQGISAEAKERERELTKDPQWQAKTQKMVSSAVDSLKYQPTKDFIPFRDSLPSNLDTVTQGAGPLEARRFLMTHPNLGEDDLKAHMQAWVQSNFVHDTKSNMLIGVPPGVGQAGEKVISWYQGNLLQKYGEKARPTLVHLGNGNYQAISLGTNTINEVLTWDQMRERHATATGLTESDRAALAEMSTKADTGSLTAADAKTYAPVLSKVRALGLQDKYQIKALNDAMDTSLRSALANIPKLSLGPVSTSVGALRNPANDPTSQKMSTVRFLGEGTPQGMAAALITQGEGVVLKASPDPAKGAGKNIGMGYNLDANASRLKEDFRKAGIPLEAIEDIKAGRKSITPAQAERLLVLSVPRYMETAQKAIDQKYPGMWDKMTPQQKAVVTDVAYQVKDFSKFGPSIDALFSGDQAKIDSAFKVHYTDQKGNTVPDTRRNNLRANLLKGPATFQAVALNN